MFFFYFTFFLVRNLESVLHKIIIIIIIIKILAIKKKTVLNTGKQYISIIVTINKEIRVFQCYYYHTQTKQKEDTNRKNESF
jgi:hypothetical protein